MNDEKWKGLGWGTLGDSITAAEGYQPLVAEALGFGRVVNYSKSGCPMSAGGDRDYGATVHMSAEVDPSLECVTVFAGVNDFRLHKPLGQPGVKDIYTFIGAYETTVERVLTANPACRLSLWTPLHRDKDGFDIETVNEAGYRLGDYAAAIRELGSRYALPVLDLYANSGFNRLTLPLFTSDGLHPNEAGHRRIAGMAIPFLLSL
ncbi:SGNH/GDSL hydrolase family protein [Gorillibacterium sp. sgz5001074]|uniref:SGNH/GDSL hydrolase family protein n=1 Tax=Gorillibacterium sp. sgz5001074 TaxID=3446695 RepID=UPI003F66281C